MGSSVMHFPHSNDGELSNRGPASLTTALGPRARASPNSPQSPTDTYGKGFLKEQGFSDNDIERIQNSRALSTRKHYRSQWELFVSWAVTKQFDPMNASLPFLTEFMDYLFRVRQVGVRKIANYKSVCVSLESTVWLRASLRRHHHPGLTQGLQARATDLALDRFCTWSIGMCC